MVNVAAVVWFVVLIVILSFVLLRFWLSEKMHRRRMLELEAIDGIVAKASRAKDLESYEFYMVEATRRLTEYSKKYP